MGGDEIGVMTAASIHLFGLELVGNRSAAAELGPIIGPVVVAAVAVYAARLAARTANERQDEQLQHDSERQERQLEREGARHEEQLAHDREMRQREHARDALDDAMESATDVSGILGQIRGSISFREDNQSEREELDATDPRYASVEAGISIAEEKVKEKGERLSAEVIALYRAAFRIQLRLGMNHPISSSFREFLESCDDIQRKLGEARKTGQHVGLDQFTQDLQISNERFSVLLITCEEWFK